MDVSQDSESTSIKSAWYGEVCSGSSGCIRRGSYRGVREVRRTDGHCPAAEQASGASFDIGHVVEDFEGLSNQEWGKKAIETYIYAQDYIRTGSHDASWAKA